MLTFSYAARTILYDIDSPRLCIGINRRALVQTPSDVSSYRLTLLLLFLTLAAEAKEGTTILVIPTEAVLLRSVTHVNKWNKSMFESLSV